MSVTVTSLSKIYGPRKAVDEVSFAVNKGEILGFLGPNGAGKTTTMKIITCFLPQTEGEVEVCGFNVRTSPDEVRQRIGYLPEHNPLYKDMYVKEYLNFTARVHKVPNKTSRIAEMIERTGLGYEQHKPIGALSKGYRQRVGLAQAMLHDPEVLILDEPTTGLDPNQLVEIRKLIKDLGREKTVIFSTHIMQEVQVLCDRVAIINRGKLVANAPIGELNEIIKGQILITVEFSKKVQQAALLNIKNISEAQHLDGNRWQLKTDASVDARPAVFQFAVEQQMILLEMHKQTASVEDVFQQLTLTKEN